MAEPFVDRYRLYGLDHNPFAVEVEQQQRVFVSRNLPSPPPGGALAMVQVIGAKGAGKTSQIQQWRRETPGPYFYVPCSPARERWRQPPIADLVYADEVDRMPSLRRAHWFRQLARVQATLVVGTHDDLRPAATRAGLDVTTHRLGPIDFATLRRVVDERIRAAATAQSPFAIEDDELCKVHAQSAGSFRTAQRLLHELVATRVLDPPEVVPSQ